MTENSERPQLVPLDTLDRFMDDLATRTHPDRMALDFCRALSAVAHDQERRLRALEAASDNGGDENA